jgi:hypothetical protein
MSHYHPFCTPSHNPIRPCKETKWMKLMESRVVVLNMVLVNYLTHFDSLIMMGIKI